MSKKEAPSPRRQPRERGRYFSTYCVMYDSPEWDRLSRDAADVLNAIKHAQENNRAGLYAPSLDVVAHRSKIAPEDVEPALAELEAERWIVREGRWVWIRNHVRYDPQHQRDNPNHVVGLLRFLETLPRIHLVARFIDYYQQPMGPNPVKPYLPPKPRLEKLAPWISSLPLYRGDPTPHGTPRGDRTPRTTTHPMGDPVSRKPLAVCRMPYAVGRKPEAGGREAPSSSGEVQEGAAPADDDKGAYVAGVLALYCRLPGTRPEPTTTDRRAAGDLFERRIPFDRVRAGLLVATLRRIGRDREAPLDPVNSLKYFFDEIEAATTYDPGYVEHLNSKLVPHMKPDPARDASGEDSIDLLDLTAEDAQPPPDPAHVSALRGALDRRKP